jgi:hypothetical protein
MPNPNLELLELAAERLRQLLPEIVFVGGCTTGLLIDDPAAAPVRDKNLRFVSLNWQLAEMNSASVAAHVGRTVKEMIPGLFPIVEPYLRRALNGEAIPKVEIPRQASRPGEADRIILLSCQPVLNEARDVIGISVAVVDATELQARIQ